MGSGETAPSLVPFHRRLLSELGRARACWFDTPYGFQENAEILSRKTADFFRDSLGTPLAVAHFLSAEISEAEKQRAYGVAQNSNYLFSGPGSPSYALEQWKGSALPSLFTQKLEPEAENVVVFASATACTIGLKCLPVYEIYKVGRKPHWLDGLNLLGLLGFRAVVLPHFNNTVGGNHDTRFCYLGENRLRKLEAELEDDVWIWGVDEHTAVVLDLKLRSFEVYGKGGFTLRRRGQSQSFVDGYQGSLEKLLHPDEAAEEAGTMHPEPLGDGPSSSTQGLITEAARGLEFQFQAALESGLGKEAVNRLLAFEQLLEDWSGDSDVHHRQLARASFRRLLEQLGEASEEGLRKPEEIFSPWVQSLLEIRNFARRERLYNVADVARDELCRHGVEVRDNATGSSDWNFRPSVQVLDSPQSGYSAGRRVLL